MPALGATTPADPYPARARTEKTLVQKTRENSWDHGSTAQSSVRELVHTATPTPQLREGLATSEWARPTNLAVRSGVMRFGRCDSKPRFLKGGALHQRICELANRCNPARSAAESGGRPTTDPRHTIQVPFNSMNMTSVLASKVVDQSPRMGKNFPSRGAKCRLLGVDRTSASY